MMDIRFPNITEPTVEGQVAQIKSYLYQLVQQLNWALSTLESSAGSSGSAMDASFGDISAETFYELKSLLIKSSDTLNAYYDKINSKLEGQYVKVSEFDEHKKSVTLSADFDAYKQEMVEKISKIDEAIAEIKQTIQSMQETGGE